MSISKADSFRLRLRTALASALKERDRAAVEAIRSTLGAIDNAEAVSAPPSPPSSGGGPIAGAKPGAGAADVARQVLTDDEVDAIVMAEIAEKRSASHEYQRLGQLEESARLRRQADLLKTLFRQDGSTAPG